MKRRVFITLLGGAVVAWPLTARAQQAMRMRRIGVLMNQAADDPEAPPRVSAFAQGLQERGERRRSLSKVRGGTARACPGCSPGHRQFDRGDSATSKPHRADRVRGDH